MAKWRYVKEQYDKSAQVLGKVVIGDKATLFCNGHRKPVTIVETTSKPRLFIVQDSEGNKFRRTRSHLAMRNVYTTRAVGQSSSCALLPTGLSRSYVNTSQKYYGSNAVVG